MPGAERHIWISLVPEVSKCSFEDFIAEIQADTLPIEIDQHSPGPFAALEWFIPTAAVLYISKSYFDGFLGEMGKDHYVLLKGAVQRLWRRVFATDDVIPTATLVSTAGKTCTTGYTLKFSILAQTIDGRVLKLMLKEDITAEEYEGAIDALFSFLDSHYSSNGKAIIPEGVGLRPGEKTVFVAYDPSLNQIQFLDWVPAEIRTKFAQNNKMQRTR